MVIFHCYVSLPEGNWDETPASFGQAKLLQVVDSMSRELARLKDGIRRDEMGHLGS